MYHQHNKSRADTLDYIHSMLGQLKMMAETESCDMLAYLLDMARIEAGDVMHAERNAGRGRPDPLG